MNGNSSMAMMSLSEAAVLTIRMASHYTIERGGKTIGTEYLLYALLLSTEFARSDVTEKENGVDNDDVQNALEAGMDAQVRIQENLRSKKSIRKKPLKWLKRFGTDLTELAKEGKLDTVIGREREIERVVTVLSRRTKSNPVLIGRRV